MTQGIQNVFVYISEMMKHYEDKHQKRMAIFYSILSQFFFTSMFLGVSLLKGEYSSIQIVNMRMITGYVFNYIFCYIYKVPLYSENTQTFRLLAFRGLIGGATMICIFTCLTLMNVSDGVVIVNTNPIWTNFLAYFALGEHLSKKSIGFCILSFVGIILVSRPASLFGESNHGSKENQNQLLGTFFGLLGSLFAAVVSIVVRKLTHEHKVNGAMHMQYNYFISIFVTATILVNDADRPFVFTFRFFYIIFLLSFSGFIAQLLFSKAFSLEKASVIAPMQNLQVVLSFLLDIFVLNNDVMFSSMAGAFFIIIGSIGILS